MKKRIIGAVFLSIFLLTACTSAPEEAVNQQTTIEDTNEEKVTVEETEEEPLDQEGLNQISQVLIEKDSAVTLGGIEDNGWLLEISEDTFSKSGTLEIKEILDTNHEMMSDSEFTVLAPLMTFEFDQQKNTRLNKPARLTLLLPEDQLDSLAYEELFYGYFYDGAWEYYTPQVIDLEEGTVSFDLYHFSGLGFGKPSEEEQINTYARMMAAKKWQQQQDSDALKNMIEPNLNQLFVDMGVKTPELRNQFSADVISYLEGATLDAGGLSPIGDLAQMVNLLNQGEKGKEAVKEKLTEFIAKGLVFSMEKDVGQFASKYNVLTNMSKAAGALYEGDKKLALEHVASMLKGAVPIAAVADSASKYIQEKGNQLIDTWAEDELDKAYKAYAYGTDKWGYDAGLKGDFKSIMTLLGGGDRQFAIRTIENHCKKFGCSPEDLTEAERLAIVSRAEKDLKKSFDERYEKEQELSAQSDKENVLTGDEEAFIKALKEKGLLSWTNYKDLFQIDEFGHNYDVRERLDHLYKMKNLIKNMLSDEAAENLMDQDMANIIDRWIYAHSKKDMDLFYDYMKERNLLKEAMPLPDYVWVLDNIIDYDAQEAMAESNKNYEGIYFDKGSYGQGNYRLQRTYVGKSDDYYNPPKVEGESIAFLGSFSSPPEMIIPGETLTINASLTPAGNSLSYFAFNGSIRAQLNNKDFTNADGKGSFKSDNKNNYESFEETLSIEIPGGSADSEMIIRYSLYLYQTMKTEYVYKYKPLE